MGECLKQGAMRSAALLFNSQWSDQAWGFFPDSIRNGSPAFEMAHGMPFFEWLGKHPGAAEIFNEANAFKAVASHRAIVDIYDFSGVQRLTDIGGGTGALMAEILVANPSMKGCVADIPPVIEKAKRYLRSRGLEDRCKAVSCDFFKGVPAGSDVYLMSHILHDWPTDRCRIILENCRKAMKPGSRLLIAEMVIPLGNGPSMAKLLDLEMLVNGGCERTEAEFRTLLESSGFRLSRIMSTQESICLMEGIRL